MAEVTYYFTYYGSSQWTDPTFMTDNILTNYASTTVDDALQSLVGSTCPGDDLGTITKVEIRCYGYGDGNDRIDVAKNITRELEREIIMPSSPNWSSYADITDWGYGWAELSTFYVYLEYDKVGKGNTMYCAKVEIRVTYTEPWPPASDIDVGADPIDRAYGFLSDRTIVDKNNPANASGTLHSVQVHAAEGMAGLIVGTFYTTNGNTLKCRDSEAIGGVEAGAMRTFTELSITVVEGDYIGCYFTAGRIDTDESGFAGIWYISGEYIDPDDEATYTFVDGDAISLYGYGDFAAGYYHGLKVQSVGEVALCDAGSNPLRMRKGGTTYGIELVDTTDPNASTTRVKVATGVKAIRKYT